MVQKVVKSTVKGQITLPKKWRNQFDTDNYVMEIDNARVTIIPLTLKNYSSEEVIFDAERDNDGKGVSIDEMIRLLKKVQNG